MPPILLLKKDPTFYTDPFKQKEVSNPEKLENVAPAPDVVSNVRMTNDNQRNNNRLTENLADPDSRENPEFSGELVKKDIEKLKGEDDIGSRFVKFLQEPIVKTSEETDRQQKKREVARITGDDTIAPPTNEIRPVGEVPRALADRVGNFIEKELLKVILLFGGIYIAGEFVKGIGRGVSEKGKKTISE